MPRNPGSQGTVTRNFLIAAALSGFAAGALALTINETRNFESDTLGAKTSSSGEAVMGTVEVVDGSVSGGSKALRLRSGTPPGEIGYFISGGSERATYWVDFKVKPQATAVDTQFVDADGAMLGLLDLGDGTAQWRIFFAGGGSGTWIDAGSPVTLGPDGTPGDFHRVTLRIDYATKSFMVFLDGARLVNFPLLLADTAISGPGTLDFYAQSAAETFVDDIGVYSLPPAGALLDINGNGLPDYWEESQWGPVTVGVVDAGHGANDDPDTDGLTNIQEFQFGLNPAQWDSAYGYLTSSTGSLNFNSEALGAKSGLRGDYFALGGVSVVDASADGRGHAVRLVNGDNALTSLGFNLGSGEYLDFWVKRGSGSADQRLGLSLGNGTPLMLNSLASGSNNWSMNDAVVSTTTAGTGGFDRVTIRYDSTKGLYRILMNGVATSDVPGAEFGNIKILYAGPAGSEYLLDDFYCGEMPSDLDPAAFDEPLDLNGNSLPDAWELTQGWTVTTGGFPSGQAPWDDPDGDGLTNEQEYLAGTLALVADTDGDGVNDGVEVATGHNPLVVDFDPEDLNQNGLPDSWETLYWEISPGYYVAGLSSSGDPDGDGLTNAQEFAEGTNPTLGDTDGDGLSDLEEVTFGLNPLQADDAMDDPDGDGIPTLCEVIHGADPALSSSKPEYDFIVDPAVVTETSETTLGTQTVRTLAELNRRVDTGTGVDYPVILIKSGTYNEQLKLYKRAVVIGERGVSPPVITGGSATDYAVTGGYDTGFVFRGLIIRSVSGGPLSGIGIGAVDTTSGLLRRSVVSDCVIDGFNEQQYSWFTNVDYVHCTFIGGASFGRIEGTAKIRVLDSLVYNSGLSGPVAANLATPFTGDYAGTRWRTSGTYDPTTWFHPNYVPKVASPGIAVARSLFPTDLYGQTRTADDAGAVTFVDNDGDGIPNLEEARIGTNPDSVDTDGDGMPDAWEISKGLNPLSASDAALDPDNDGLTNAQEFAAGTNPNVSDITSSVSGAWLREQWNTIASVRISDLEAKTSGYTTTPAAKNLFAANEAYANRGDNYGERLRASITVPAEGDYVFAVSGADDVRFSLSTDSHVGGVRPIASVTGSTSRYEWTKFPSQRSATVHLVPGVQYYAEIVHQSGTGEDHFALGYRLASEADSAIRLVPSGWLTSFVSDTQDADGDGLPDSWETANTLATTGTGAATGVNGRLGDSDADGLTNLEEYRFGTNPKAANIPAYGSTFSGALLRDIWKGITTTNLTTVATDTRNFTTAPTTRTLFAGSETTLSSVAYAERLQGFVVPPVTGDYRFAISSDDMSEVWLSTDATQANAVRIAGFTSGWTGVRSYAEKTGQSSAPVHLVAGQSYYIDIRHVNIGAATGFMSLAWRTADTQAWAAVPSSALKAGLPADDFQHGTGAAWERIYGIPGYVIDRIWPGTYQSSLVWVPNPVEAMLHSPAVRATTPVLTLVAGAASQVNAAPLSLREVTAYVTPSTTGDYALALSADDVGVLYVSEDETPARLRRVAAVYSSTAVNDFTVYPASGLLRLEAGKRYLIRAFSFDFGGNDAISLGWKTPGSSTIVPIPAANVSPAAPLPLYTPDGARLAFVDDDGDGVNNLRESQLGTNPAAADSDGDGISDLDEIALGLNPLAADDFQNGTGPAWDRIAAATGYVIDRVWPGTYQSALGGVSNPVEAMLLSSSVRATTPVVNLVAGSASRLNAAPLSVRELTAYVAPSTTGDYALALAADDIGVLYVSEDETPAKLRRVATVLSSTAVNDFTVYPASGILRLEAGKRYLIRAFSFDFGGNDAIGLGWKTPGSSTIVPIPATNVLPAAPLSLYTPDGTRLAFADDDGDGFNNLRESQLGTNPASADSDGDGLPDFWEVSNGLNPLTSDATSDPDGDGLTNAQEYAAGTNPLVSNIASGAPGAWLREQWNSVTGVRIWDLESSKTAGFTTTPDTKNLFAANEAYANRGDNYGERLRGWIKVPAEGDYVFVLSGADDVRFSLSTDSHVGGVRPVATIVGATGRYEWNKYSSQRTVTLHLLPGVSYYAEIVHQSGTGEDHFALAYKLASEADSAIRLVPTSWIASFTGDALDADGDGLPDAWEIANTLATTGTAAATGNNGALGDPDGDGISNREEYRRGTNPKVSNVPVVGGAPVTGGLVRDIWKGITTTNLTTVATATSNYTTTPTTRTVHSSSETTLSSVAYGERLYGFITPPATGDYRFAIASDDMSEVWLSTDGTQEHAVKIAGFTSGWTAIRSYAEKAAQVSAPVHLLAGRAYFLDIRHVNIGAGAGHMSLAWRTSDTQAWQSVPASVLTAGFPGNDINGNGLPDDWEIARGWTVTPGVIVAGHGATDDPDGDGFTNAQEQTNGTNPDVPDIVSVDTDGDGIPDADELGLTGTDPADAYTEGFPAPYNDSYGAYGYAAIERWTGFSSAPVLDTFRQSAAVNTPASAGLTKSRILTKTLLSKGTTGSGAVVERIRGWIIPTQNGPWSVSVVMEKGASAGTAMLRLSTDDTPYLATEKLRFSPVAAQDSASATVTLEAGKAYYYEVWLVKPDASVDARVDAAPVLL